MNVSIKPTHSISGEIRAPPSKAVTHRALFAGLLSKGTTLIHNPLSCNDTKATKNAISALGASLECGSEIWTVKSDGVPRTPSQPIECGESGVTLRFTIPIASMAGAEVILTGAAGLMRRPLRPLIDAMQQIGVQVDVNGVEVRVKGAQNEGGNVQLPGDVSSQFLSGLLFAAPFMEEGLEIIVTSALESRGYVSLTIETLRQHGINVQVNGGMSSFRVAPHQTYRAADHVIPGDYSSAAYLMSAAAVTRSKILLTGLSQDKSDPDSTFLEILTKMGVKPEVSSGALHVEGHGLKAARVNVSDCPDLGPIIAVLGSQAEGETEIVGAERLRYKESDRLASIASELGKLGAEIRETSTGLLVSGPARLQGRTVESHGDHRIAMALTVAALNASNPVTIRDAQCVNKSYPGFFDGMRSLGVDVSER